MIETISRALTDHEREFVRRTIDEESRRPRPGLVRSLSVSFGLCGLICAYHLAVSKGPAGWIIAFWSAMAFFFGLSTHVEHASRSQRRIGQLRRALQRNLASETRIQATEVVALEEIADLGNGYAFQVSDDQIVFICGQEFEDTPDFPNTDFSLVEIVGDARTTPVDGFALYHGKKLVPIREVPTASQHVDRMRNHLDIITGKLADLEAHL